MNRIEIIDELSFELKTEIWDKLIHPQYFYEELIYYDFFREVIPYLTWFHSSNEEDKKRYIRDNYGIHNPDTIIKNGIVYDAENKIIGWMCWNVTENFRKKKTSTLKYIIIDTKIQKNGIGSMMMKEYLNWCFHNGIKEAFLCFRFYIEGLKEFYSKWGFKGNNNPYGSHITWDRKITREIKRIPKSKK